MAVNIEKLIELIKSDNGEIIRYKLTNQWTDEDCIEAYKAAGEARGVKVVITDANRNCIVQLMRWLTGNEQFQCLTSDGRLTVNGRIDRGIYLYGPTGTGKTLSMALMKAISRACGMRYSKFSQERSLTWNTYRADDLVDRFIRGDSLQELKNETIICIEDLGSEPTEALYMGTRYNVLRTLLEQRGDKTGLITLITSNLPLNAPELVTKYGDRVVSRLCDMTNFLVLKGQDYRKRKI